MKTGSAHTGWAQHRRGNRPKQVLCPGRNPGKRGIKKMLDNKNIWAGIWSEDQMPAFFIEWIMKNCGVPAGRMDERRHLANASLQHREVGLKGPEGLPGRVKSMRCFHPARQNNPSVCSASSSPCTGEPLARSAGPEGETKQPHAAGEAKIRNFFKNLLTLPW